LAAASRTATATKPLIASQRHVPAP
jgi:hypothetical protein